MPGQRFEFEFSPLYRVAAAGFAVLPTTAYVELDDRRLSARFGPWRLVTPLDNITGTQLTGPFSVPRTIGPAHLSFKDRGLTFATNPRRGLCISFAEPVPGLEPTGRLRHPALTVTVADCAGLRDALTARLDPGR